MKIIGNGRVYKNQYGYSISDNQKQKDGTYNNFYIPIYFAKDLKEPNDRDYITINGFTKPFKYKDDKLGICYIITNYSLGEEKNETKTKTKAQEQQEILKEVVNQEDPFESFGKEVQILDDDLPF